jgi:hypothetical protein
VVDVCPHDESLADTRDELDLEAGALAKNATYAHSSELQQRAG